MLLTFEQPGALEGRCLDARSQPLVGRVAATSTRSGLMSPEDVKPDGTFAFKSLPPGSYQVRFTPEGTPGRSLAGNVGLAPRTVVVASGATARADFTLSAGASLKVTAAPASGGTVSGNVLLLPGTVAAPTRTSDLSELLARATRGARQDNVWDFSSVPQGHYTVLLVVRMSHELGAMVQGVDCDGQTPVQATLAVPEVLPEPKP